MNVPEDLRDRPQWLVWKFINKAGQKKPAKMPYYATTGQIRGWPYGKPKDGEATEEQPQVDQGHPIDRENLVDFETALEVSALRGFDGVGFAFLPGDGLIGIDLDAACAEKHGRIMEACGSFAERSPSGTGVHIIGLGECETFKSNDVGVEVFCGRQFFTVTGAHVGTTPLELRAIPADALDKLRRTVERAKEAARAAKHGEEVPARGPVVPAQGGASRYCLAALESSVQRLRGAVEGGRNDLLNGEAFGLAQLVHTGGISEAVIRAALFDAALACGLPAGEAKATIASGIRAGMAQPRAIPERPERAERPAVAQRVDPETGEILPEEPAPPPPPANDNAEPMDVFAEYPAPELAAGMLPKAIAGYAFECSELIGVSAAMVAVPALVACAAALHDEVRIQPKRHEMDWTESARLWCAVVGDPSVKKSPAIRRATKRVRKIDIELHEENAQKLAAHAEQMEQYKEAKKEAKKSGAFVAAPEAPPTPRMVVEDITVEALSEVLKDSPRGVLCIQDELSGWFGAMDAYSGGRNTGKDRAAWLQAYNGGPRLVDRVMRGAVMIPNFSVCMIGGIQPDAIRRLAANMTDDGLMQRFMIVIGSNRVELDRLENKAAYAEFSRLVDHLHRIVPGAEPVRLSEEAHRVREDLMAYVEQLVGFGALPSGLRSHLGKWSGLFARLLLVFHAIECAGRGEHPQSVVAGAEVAARVDRFMRRFLLPHALAYYTDVLGASSDLEHVRWVAGHVLSKGLTAINNRELTQAYKAWRGLDDWRRARVMALLEDMGWIVAIPDDGKTGRRGAQHWAVNPAVHGVFARKAKEEGRRRDRIRAELAALQGRM